MGEKIIIEHEEDIGKGVEAVITERSSSDVDISRSQSTAQIEKPSDEVSNDISTGQDHSADKAGAGINGSNTNGVNGHVNGHTTPNDVDPLPAKHTPIAIVGMACRLPGEVSNPDEFWELCSRARSGWSEFPGERFLADSFYHPNPGKPGSFNPKGGHFLRDLASFDAPFFNMTAQEAKSLDPQQRLLLECTFEALENAGIPKHTIAGRDVGVFIGGSFSEYDAEGFRDSETLPMYHVTGTHFAVQANRLSYFFDFRGPSVAMDTACSSSLSALHLACQSIRTGESSLAVVGGCHLNMLPELWISMSMSRLFSDDGRSYSFDERGNGFGRGEGCGMIVLKPLDEAIRSNDSIRAVIAATGINQDGKTPGITMPSGPAQEALIRSVYKNAGINPRDTGFVEAHGTGTKVGDPIEAAALHSCFGEGRNSRQPLYIGSVKSNIGHLEGASGIVAVIKAALMLERGFILPNFDFKIPNKKIPFTEWNLKVPTTQRPWPRNKKFASVNNFGFGGTNAHAVLERAPFLRNDDKVLVESGRKLFVLTANDKSALKSQMKNLGIYLEQRPEIFQNALMGNLAYTLGQRRSLLPWKVVIPARTAFDLVSTLSSSSLTLVRETETPRIGFVFTGQGAQWHAMGRELLGQYPVFASTLEAADTYLSKLGAPFSLLEELNQDAATSKVREAVISQPACTAIQLGLTDLLKSWGIQPAAVTGHSSGEIGAAYAAGILGLEACMAIAYYRGSAAVELRNNHPSLIGAMVAVGAGPEEISKSTTGLKEGTVKIACINSPTSVTVSGDEPAISELQTLLDKKQIFNRKLQVDIAYHSHHMNLVAENYLEAIKHVSPVLSSDVVFYSSLMGDRIDDTTLLGAGYWVDNLTSPVRFSEALQAMCQPSDKFKTRVNCIVELGPHSALGGPIKQILKSLGENAAKIPYIPTLVRNKDAVETTLQTASALFLRGAILDFGAINFPRPGKKPILLTDMPRYSWNHSAKYWHESRISKRHKSRNVARHDILGTLANYSNDLEPTWRSVIRADDLPWLRQHQLQSDGKIVFPAAAFIVMALEAASQHGVAEGLQFDDFELRNVSFNSPLVIGDEDVEITITLRSRKDRELFSVEAWSEFRICSWFSSTGWTEHCKGLIAVKLKSTDFLVDDDHRQRGEDLLKGLLSRTNAACSLPVPKERMYESLAKLGAIYGPVFQGIDNCRACDSCSVADITVPNTAQTMPLGFQSEYIIHPAVLQQIINMYLPMLGVNQSHNHQFFLPSFISKISICRRVTAYTENAGDTLQAFCIGNRPFNSKTANVKVLATVPDDFNEALITIDAMTLSPVRREDSLSETDVYRELCFKMQWELASQTLELSKLEIPESLIKSTDELPTSSTEVVIIEAPGSSNPIVSKIEDIVQGWNGKKPVVGSLGQVNAYGKFCIFLAELDEPFLAAVTKPQFDALQSLFTGVKGILWVVRGAYTNSDLPEANMVTGLSRTIRSETLLQFATIDLDSHPKLSDDDTTKVILSTTKFLMTSTSPNTEMEFMERGGKLYVPRVVNDAELNKFVHQETQSSAPELLPFNQGERRLQLNTESPASLDNLYFMEQIQETPLQDDEIEIRVKAIGVNVSDFKSATGQSSTEDHDYLGIECSGIVTSVGEKVTSLAVGDRIAAITKDAYATFTRTQAAYAFKVRSNMSFEVAAAIPVAYCTAYHGLLDTARLCKGQRLLVNVATSSIGQAAILLAQAVGAETFATVSNFEQKELIMKEYNIDEHRIFYIGSSFSEAIQIATHGEGVDLVLNCAHSHSSQEIWDSLGRFGSFIETGQPESSISGIRRNVNFSSVDLVAIIAERPKLMQRLIADISKLLDSRTIWPASPITVFPISKLETVLRYIERGEVHGKLVVAPKSRDQVKAIPPKIPKNILHANASYILIGGTGGLGRSMTKWFVEKGARHIVLVSRSGAMTEKIHSLIDELSTSGAEILIRRCDITDREQVEALVQGMQDMPPIKGVIHGAMVLRDILFEKMAYDDYTSVIEPKVSGAWNFHHALNKISLDFFITISSAAGTIGNRGQAAYSAANTFLDAFVQYRIARGLPATTINLTAVSDVGYIADNAERAAEVAKNFGGETINEVEVLSLLGAAITGRMATACNHHCITGMRITDSAPPFWSSDPKFTHLVEAAVAAASTQSTEAVKISLSSALRASRSIEEAENVVREGLVDKVASLVMLEKEEMDISKSIADYGLDSLVVIELRNFITREFEANMQVLELLNSGSITALAKTVCGKSKLVTVEVVAKNDA